MYPYYLAQISRNTYKILLEHRDRLFTKHNLYFSGNPNTSETICGYKILSKHARNSGAKNPGASTSTKLQKHLASLSQVFAMSDNDMKQLAGFMGHTLGVHKKGRYRGSYRLPNDLY